ncbi:MAG: tetratricopeptide repeat protein [Spirochaetaceae bacterium]|jgi:tetratricopeptide (TPR) repeat protein|nr:tetratricopeptide repeat protein [Spirochaetaceae bacterium]
MKVTDYFERGEALMKRGRFDPAIEVLGEGLAERPDDVKLLSGRAIVYFLKGEMDKALADLTRVVTLAPEDPEGWKTRVAIYIEVGEYGKAIDDLAECIALLPEDPDFWCDRGSLYAEMGEYDKALADFDECMARLSEVSAGTWYNRGCVYLRMGEYGKAIEDYTRCIALDSDISGVWRNRGYAYLYSNERGKALADFDKYLALSPSDAEVCFSRGQLLSKMGEHDKAIADFTLCLALEPEKRTKYMRYRSYARFEKGDLEGALEDADKSIACCKDPKDFACAYITRGFSWRNLGKLDKALKDFMLAMEYDPQNYDALFQAGCLLMQQEDFEKAAAFFSKALELRDDLADIWLARGGCYRNISTVTRGGYWHKGVHDLMDQAIADFTEVIKREPGWAQPYFHRGSVWCCMAHDTGNIIKAVIAQKAVKEVKRIQLLSELELLSDDDIAFEMDAVLKGMNTGRDKKEVDELTRLGAMAEKGARDSIEDLSRAIELMDKLNAGPGAFSFAEGPRPVSFLEEISFAKASYADAFYVRGLSYAFLGEEGKALADFNKTEVLHPNHPGAAEERAKLLAGLD